MYMTAAVLLGIAGCLFCLAALVYWRRIAQSREVSDSRSMLIVGVGMVTLTVALVLSLIDHSRRDFTFAVLSCWSAVAAILFVKRFLAMPSRGLLVLPIGAIAIMLAVLSVIDQPQRPASGDDALPVIVLIHILFMVFYLAANLVGASAAVCFFIADRQLKSASERAFKLPSLPSLRRVTVAGLVASCATLFAGLVTGSAAVTLVEEFDYTHPIIITSIVSMVLLIVLLFLDVKRGLNQRALSIASLLILLLTVIAMVSLNLHSPYA